MHFRVLTSIVSIADLKLKKCASVLTPYLHVVILVKLRLRHAAVVKQSLSLSTISYRLRDAYVTLT